MYMRQRMYVCIHIYVCKSKSSNKKLLLASFGENRCVSKQKRGVSKQNRGVSKQNRSVSKQNRGVSRQNRSVSKQNRGVSKQNRSVSKQNRGVSKQNRSVSKQNRGVSKQNLFCHELLHRERSITRNFVMVKKSIAGQNFRHFVRRAKCTAALRGHFEGDPSH